MNIDPLIKQFLLEWAEDEFWVGHLMAKKVYDYGPDLEENIAIGSISQDEMGHCRMLLRTITESKSEKEMDMLMYERLPEQLRVSRLAEYWYEYDWVKLIIKQLFYEVVDNERFKFSKKLSLEIIQNISNIMEREESIHLEHWTEWALIISKDEKGRMKIQETVDEIYPLISDFFSGTLYKEISDKYLDVPSKPEEFLSQSLQKINKILSLLNVDIPYSEEQMIAKLVEKGGRDGIHSEGFSLLYDELTTVYRESPDMVWS
ncbi:Phenylacetic acid catabolic protein [Fredinandcohnia onubensis]|uniref:Phenylacetic acid catabolic protein n=1 Tax=Fredinandcohnia onubensis TaxID=1571209 RepID=UPI000C0C0E3F|nr:Phenylacetic acid catabolic protein [Fredinandcohnia onubensis]